MSTTTPPIPPAPPAAAGAPRVLVVLHSSAWTGIARLPRALALAGFEVAALCPTDSFLALTRFNHRRFMLPAEGNPLYALDAAVRQFQPEWLIPGCDASAYWLENILQAQAEGRWPAAAAHLPALVRRSLGGGSSLPRRMSKHDNLALAHTLGLHVPVQHLVQDETQALAAAARLGWPVVLKSEHGSAGQTVRVCADEAELRHGFRAPSQLVPGQRLAAQAFVTGKIAMCAGVAVDGQLLESVCALKLHTHPQPTSPCSTYQVIEHADMDDALARMVRAHRFTGLCAIDVVIENGSGRPWLLEFNPRPTPVSASAALTGHDLCRAWSAHLRGQPYQRPTPLTPHDTVALFPNEWQRDPRSPHLSQGHHDLPHDDPVLARALWRSIGVAPPRTV